MQIEGSLEGPMLLSKRPLGDCLEGLVQMLSPLFVQRTYSAGSFLVKQVNSLSNLCGILANWITQVTQVHPAAVCLHVCLCMPLCLLYMVKTWCGTCRGVAVMVWHM